MWNINAWSQVTEEAEGIALAHAKGDYQRGIISGYENLSGSTLKGKAQKYSGKYYHSRMALLHRLCGDPRLQVGERTVDKRRVLVISTTY